MEDKQQKPLSRNEYIHSKGFDMFSLDAPIENFASEDMTAYNRIKVGVKKLEDATLELGSFKKAFPTHGYVNKNYIYKVLSDNNVAEMRNISNFYYNTNGIYRRLCDYFAFLYRYDWYVVPEVYDKTVKTEKLEKDLTRILSYLDNSYIRKVCGEIALEVIKNGCYYGYIVPNGTGLILQQLPAGYCRTRYSVRGFPAIEFNMQFFDTFSDPAYRLKVLKLFPDDFSKGYLLYKQGKLNTEYPTDSNGSWYLLDPESTVKFNFNGSDIPTFITTIPALLDLDAAQDLDRRKQMQKLLKILVQKLPMDKNGDLIFDNDEARDIHNNTVKMLRRAIGVDVITTFADVESIDISDRNTTTSTDDLEKVERTVFNTSGISRNLFNTDGNMSLEKSILNDESTVRNLKLQFEMFFDRVTQALNTNKKKYNFSFYMLETTQYNYKDLSKMYKEQTQLGFSKVLAQIALGHSQSFIYNTIYFENDVLNLSEKMIPPLMSSTLSGEDILGRKDSSNNNKSQNNVSAEKSTGGRPEKPDDQKSDKTIANKESMS